MRKLQGLKILLNRFIIWVGLLIYLKNRAYHVLRLDGLCDFWHLISV